MGRAPEGALLESVVDQLPVGVLVVDASGAVIFANREYERLFERAGGGNFLDGGHPVVTRPDGTPLSASELPGVRALRENVRVDEVVAYERADGSVRPLRMWAHPVRDDAGRLTAVAVMLVDATLQQARERAERDFITNAAHELQSPIAAVLAAAEALQAGAKHEPRDRDRFISHIMAACERLARLTNALLVLARAETGAEPAKREVVPLAPLLRAVAASAPVGDDVELKVSCSGDAAALAHPGLLEQAVANVVANATKYTKSGSITVTAARRDGSVEIVVADTGSGIAAADQDRIRRRFVRLETGGGGFGLGLAITDQAVRAMDGRLRIESQPGRGTNVTIVLPAATVIAT